MSTIAVFGDSISKGVILDGSSYKVSESAFSTLCAKFFHADIEKNIQL